LRIELHDPQVIVTTDNKDFKLFGN
jgi:hypothetical protein